MTERISQPFLTHIEFRAQTYDIDFAGIVSNIVYIRWLEDLRLKLLDETWPLEEQLRHGYTAVLLSTEIQYERAIRLLERPVGSIWLSELGRVRFTMQAEFRLGDTVTTRARQTVAFVRTSTFRPSRIPTAFREIFEGKCGDANGGFVH